MTVLYSSVILLILSAAITSVEMAPDVPTITLSSGGKMPVVGYGTWQAKEEELEKAVELALETGYRHIDTAHVYENEGVIGRVLKRWFDSGKITRKDIFLVTKLPPSGNRAESVSKFLNKSLALLQVDYVDLYLVHTPFGFKDVPGNLHPTNEKGEIEIDVTTDHVSLWKEMEKQVDAGLTKAIGISNFNKSQIARILDIARIKPSSLQIEIHAYNQQKPLVDFCKENNITVTAYSPLGSPGLKKLFGQDFSLPDILGNPTVKAIADKHKKTTAQVLLRHAVQKGLVVIPKSTNADRLRQNIEIFDFTLDDKELAELNNLDTKLRILDFNTFKGINKHPEYPFRNKE